jgi:hypothetical protein
MSGEGLSIRIPDRRLPRQRHAEAEEVIRSSELLLDADETQESLLEAARHRALQESQRDRSEFLGVPAEQVSPPNPFVSFAVSPTSTSSSPTPRVGGPKKQTKKSPKRRLTRRFTRKNSPQGLNLVNVVNKTLKRVSSEFLKKNRL